MSDDLPKNLPVARISIECRLCTPARLLENYAGGAAGSFDKALGESAVEFRKHLLEVHGQEIA